MRLHQQERVLKTSQLQETAEFTIKATPKAFRILIDGLYSNKQEAIVRELSSNAYDAHVVAGNRLQPFDVHLPNRLEPWLEIKDYGTGLAHDRMMRLYVTIFDTDKDDTNDLVGGLGLGSKSPFSYASSFTVTSVFDKEKRVYNAFLNEVGQPHIALMHTEDCVDVPGLSVKMQVKSDDMEAFNNAAKRVYRRYDPLPNILGNSNFELDQIEYLVEGKFWKLRKKVQTSYSNYGTGRYSRDNSVNQATAIQGTVAYPIDVNSLSNASEKALHVAGMPIDINFDIGDLDIAASREKLSYDDVTITNIIQRLETVYQDILNRVQKEFVSCNTLYEARLHLEKVKEVTQYYPSNITDNLKFKGRKVEAHIRFLTQNVSYYYNLDPSTYKFPGKLYVLGAYGLGSTSPRLNNSECNNHQASEKELFLLDDIEKGLGPHLRWLLDEEHIKDINTVYIIRDATKDQCKELLKYLGGVPLSKFKIRSELPERPKSTVANGTRATYAAIKEYNGGGWNYHQSYNRDNWTPIQYKMEDGGVYVELNAGDSGREFYHNTNYIEQLSLDPPTKLQTIYGISGTSRKKRFEELRAKGVWIHYSDVLEEYLLSQLDKYKKEYYQYMTQDNDPIYDSFIMILLRGLKNKKNILYSIDKTVSAALSESIIKHMDALNANIEQLDTAKLNAKKGGILKGTQNRLSMSDILDKMYEYYPMLIEFEMSQRKPLRSYQSVPKWHKHITSVVEYINLIDSQKGS